MLDAAQLASVKLQEEELLSWRLVDPAELTDHLLGSLGLRTQEAYRVLLSGEGTVELENGRGPQAS